MSEYLPDFINEIYSWLTPGQWGLFAVTMFFVSALFSFGFLYLASEEYFLVAGGLKEDQRKFGPSLGMLVFILKNIFALVIFILGLVLFLLPGQGLVLMAVGVAIGSFPGKDYLLSLIHI